jgi:endonuclease/exonuclease/phosphatase family metal-dependent hydrolase
MSSVSVGTFNVENLFARYRFRSNFDPTGDDGFTINNTAFDILNETAKQITAKAIRETDADILGLQEIENLKVLDRFISRYLGGKGYKHRILIDAFDPRHIDVALISRHPIVGVRTYRQERNSKKTSGLFSRDCLEVVIDVDGKHLTVYVNHFKSMIRKRNDTKARREEQVERVAKIITDNWNDTNFEGNFIVLGDFNDYIDPDTSLTKLIDHPGLVNVSDRIDTENRWTHYWAKENEYRQLDYILVSKSLAESNSNAPDIMRKGLPFRAEEYTGPRFDFVGEDNPKASDHCPLIINLNLD